MRPTKSSVLTPSRPTAAVLQNEEAELANAVATAAAAAAGCMLGEGLDSVLLLGNPRPKTLIIQASETLLACFAYHS